MVVDKFKQNCTLLFAAELTQRYMMDLPVCSGNQWCYHRVAQEDVPSMATLKKGRTYNIELTSNNEVLLVSTLRRIKKKQNNNKKNTTFSCRISESI